MPPIETADLKSALADKGFKKDDTHHEMWWFYFGDKKTSVRTRISHGVREYDDYLLGQVAKQMKITRAQLNAFVDCNFSGEGYRDHLVASGHVRVAIGKCTQCQCDGWQDRNNDGRCDNTSIPGQFRAGRCDHERVLHTRS